ncbi:VOC family protein [Winogradskyella sp.]|jgi:predicted enzyme related to lactoylglutathione lyase|uniref:VOC family protein n=1 Tax=Winogradskyella sp. TaxID=1883156 RepID=UPI0025F871A2|nr:VOC family protein [Winogradskyella sp.]MCT4629101.1 VOC family protein [Winogradskyella sp.]
MKSNTIIFADLSTYSPKETIPFYENVFGWTYYKDYDYYVAYKGDKDIVGLYETPEKFKQMRMPHFWMTYIQVNDTKSTVAKARELGGIIEMEQTMEGFGKVALIRDPQGAGFTIYEGDNLKTTRTKNEANTLVWNELHISKAANIIPFYEGIFDWNFVEKQSGYFEIYSQNNKHVADALQIPNNYKGKYEYWVCTFGVQDLKEAKDKVMNHGGSLVYDEGERILMTDNSGQAFFYIQEVK